MFVDALDECESTEDAHNLMDLLTNIGHCHDVGRLHLQVCISSRHYPNVGFTEPLQIIVESANERDITRYIQAKLQQIGDGTFPSDLSTEIMRRAEGMFLWAYLVLRQIRGAVRDREPITKIRSIIRAIPKYLGEVFQELIKSIADKDREQSNLLVTWVFHAKRPLSLSELAEAVGFKKEFVMYRDYTESDHLLQLEQMKTLLAKYTRGLVEVVEIQQPIYSWSGAQDLPTSRVQFIHETVREYLSLHGTLFLTEADEDWSRIGFVDHVLAMTCFNYIRAVCTGSEFTEKILAQPSPSQSPIYDHDTGYTFQKKLYNLHSKERPLIEYSIQYSFHHAELADSMGFAPSYLLESSIDPWWTSYASIFILYWTWV